MLLVGLSIGVAPGALGAQDSFACSVEDGVVSWSDQGADRYFVREVNNGDDSFLGRVNAGDPLSFPVDGTADSYIVRFRVGGVISEATCALGVLDPGTFSCSVADGVLSWTDQGADRYFVREVNGVEDSFVGRSESLSFPVDGTADSYIVRFRVGGVISDATCALGVLDPGTFSCSVADGVLSWTRLLYTSPSPRDQRGARMPSSA